jgi:hypothetical protein
MVRPEGGRDTADSIENAQLTLIPGMGHDLPLRAGAVANEIAKTAARAG